MQEMLEKYGGDKLKLTEYKGIEIHVDELGGKFYADIGGTIEKAETLIKLREAIDKYLKPKRIDLPIYYYTGWGSEPNFIKGKISSVTEDKKEAWYILVDGRRGKCNDFFRDNPENVTKIEKYIALKKQIKILHTEVSQLFESLEKVDLSKVVND